MMDIILAKKITLSITTPLICIAIVRIVNDIKTYKTDGLSYVPALIRWFTE